MLGPFSMPDMILRRLQDSVVQVICKYNATLCNYSQSSGSVGVLKPSPMDTEGWLRVSSDPHQIWGLGGQALWQSYTPNTVLPIAFYTHHWLNARHKVVLNASNQFVAYGYANSISGVLHNPRSYIWRMEQSRQKAPGILSQSPFLLLPLCVLPQMFAP